MNCLPCYFKMCNLPSLCERTLNYSGLALPDPFSVFSNNKPLLIIAEIKVTLQTNFKYLNLHYSNLISDQRMLL